RRPTAIFCTFDPLAELFYVVLSKKGLRVPEDVSLVGCGARERTGALTQRLTSITIDESQLGSHSVQLLHQQRHNSQAPGIAPRQLLPIHLFAGRTLTQGSPEPQFHGGGISREP